MAAVRTINPVRRLVLDPAPLLQTWVGYGLWLLIAAMAAVWMTGRGMANPMMVFSASVVTVSYIAKVKTWETLPVSRWALGRTQWWYLLGRPYLLATLSAGLAAGADAVFGWLHAGPIDILAFLAGELALLTLIGVAPPLGAGLAGLFSSAGNFAAFGVLYLAALALAFHWSLETDAFAAVRGEMLIGGAIAVVTAVVAYALTPWTPLARNAMLNRPARQTLPASKAASARPAAVAGLRRRPNGGWAVFSPLFNKGLRILLLCALAACVLGLPPVRYAIARIVPPDVLLLFLPVMMAVGALTLTTIAPQRVLAGLPLSALTRTVALVAVSPALQLPLAGVIIVTANAMTAGHPGAYWLPQMGMSVLGGLSLSALSLPMTLRFGQKGPVMMILAWAPLGFISGVVASLAVARKDPGLVLPSMAVVLAVIMAGAWVWTWLEIAYGRAIYRQWTWQPVNWRGS